MHLGDARRALYNDLHAVARHEEAGLLDIPATIAAEVPADGLQAADHLFVDMEGQFPVRLNEWEQIVLDAERARADFVTWIRNFDRKSWALAFPYSHGGHKLPGYPDFITVTGTPEAPVFNILEPHRGEDSVAEAKGLAEFADRHGTSFGRIELIRVDDRDVRRLNLNDRRLRAAVLPIQSHDELIRLFDHPAAASP